MLDPGVMTTFGRTGESLVQPAVDQVLASPPLGCPAEVRLTGGREVTTKPELIRGEETVG